MSDTLSPRRPDTADLSGCCLLVIENDLDNLEMFATFFRYCGAEVATAQTVEVAFECLSGERIDAIITDVVFTGRIGDFVTRIRNSPRYKSTPIIAVTGWPRKNLVPDAAQFDAFMLKPVNLDDLAMTIRGLLPVA